MNVDQNQTTRWVDACDKSRGRTLAGIHAHYCIEYNDVPVDETCPEWPCTCFEERRNTEVEEGDGVT